MIHIYGLIEKGKDINQIGYIGLSEKTKGRLQQHRTCVEDTEKGHWIASLRKDGKTVEMILLDSAKDRNEAHIKENAWIIFAKSRGWPITNGTSPGEHRALLETEIRTIEDAIALMRKELNAKDEVAQGLRVDMDATDKRFRKWYQVTIGLILGALSIWITQWLVRSFPYYDVVEKYGMFDAACWIVGMSVAYPFIAFVFWFFLKDVPLYKPNAGTSLWLASLDNDQSMSWESLKRIFWHTVATIAIFAAIVIFDS